MRGPGDHDERPEAIDVQPVLVIAPVPRIALRRKEAAAALGMSLRLFEQAVQPHLRLIREGRLVLVPVAELERWAHEAATHALQRDPAAGRYPETTRPRRRSTRPGA